MVSVAALIAAMSGPTNERRQRRTRRIIKGFVFLFFSLAGLGFTALGAYLVWSEWHADQSSLAPLFADAMPFALWAWGMESLAVIALAARSRSTEASRPIVAVFRDLLARNDDRVTPLARFQPLRDASSSATNLPLTIRPIRYATEIRYPAIAGVFAAFVTVGLSASICATTTWPTSAVTRLPQQLYQLPFVLVALVAVVLTFAYLRARFGTRRRGPKLVLTERGILAGSGRRKHQLAWDQIRSVAQIIVGPPTATVTIPDFAPTLGANLTIYLADDGVAPLQWSLTNTASEAEVKASETLLRQIVTRTGLTLRDGTALATELSQYASPQARVIRDQRTRIGAGAEIAQAIRAVLPPLAAPVPKPSRLKIATITAIVLVLGLANAVFLVGALRLEHIRDRFNASYLATLRSPGPIYATDFSANDGNWPARTASDTDFRTYGFDGGAYHLTGSKSDQFIDALFPLKFGDVAVEVTVAQRAGITPIASLAYPAGAGLVAHASGENATMLAFYIATDGHWTLQRYAHVDEHASDNWHDLDGGSSSAIRNGLGAENTLLLIQRQRHISLYINGTRVVDDDFADAYYGDVPEFGYAGVYSDQSGVDVAFTRFALYRLPEPPDFWTALRTG
jgi:hypothetical protein